MGGERGWTGTCELQLGVDLAGNGLEQVRRRYDGHCREFDELV